MTRVGKVALEHLADPDDFTHCLHSLGDLSPERRFIMHFPEDNAVSSIGSGYKAATRCSARSAWRCGWRARSDKKEGWLAEHMLILGLQDPSGKMHYVTGAFPSACGKTNLAMLVPPASMPGWKIWTVGDDIAWLRKGATTAGSGGSTPSQVSSAWCLAPGQDQSDGDTDDPARHDLYERRATA